MAGDVVYLLVVTGVYDQGVAAAYRDPDRAERAAGELLAGSDGHHDIEVRPVILDIDPDRSEWASTMRYDSPRQRGTGRVVRRWVDEGAIRGR